MLDVLFWIKSAIGLVFLSIASYQDLKTTEISDKLLYLFILASVIINTLAYLSSRNKEIIANSIINGVILSLVGALMYFTGQWGAGDSFLLAGVGFLNPLNQDIVFTLEYFFLLAISGMIYVILYSFTIFVKNEKARKNVEREFNKRSKAIGLISLFLLASISAFILTNSEKFIVASSIIFVVLILSISFVYLKGIENSMIKKVRIKDVKVGDVLKDSKKWVGIDEKALKKLRRSRKFVYIKEGVRFAPVFLIAFILLIAETNTLNSFISFLQQLFLL
ncbi:MAG: prepilin peptidase [Candidatus Aenigmarchaeota archaeon]|nr:prepilin peptidase [Candidatus Aenigmarchaeota archaeon]